MCVCVCVPINYMCNLGNSKRGFPRPPRILAHISPTLTAQHAHIFFTARQQIGLKIDHGPSGWHKVRMVRYRNRRHRLGLHRVRMG